ncbi:hypothetical protein HZH68_009380 [Vespula germanica]|uniref:Uncharacterized protein n=1 Tax=Vespula germanica TaxID=30212 RepID=A0A834N4C5_VESGE|nr:hypothetical protein HZH68_009380 [Vespula germanica]
MVKRLMKEKPSSSRLLFRKCGAKARTKAWRRNATSMYMEKWEYSPTRDDNKIGPLTDFDSYWFSLALNFDESTSYFSQYAFNTSNKEELIYTWRSGDTLPPVTTTKSGL